MKLKKNLMKFRLYNQDKNITRKWKFINKNFPNK